jgi:two-component system, cell cycle response regulator
MIYVLASAVAVLAFVAVVTAAALARRSSKRADRRVAELVETLNSRIDELAKELAGAREQAEEELRRNRTLSELGGTIDLDEVLSRVLEAASEATRADGALVWLGTPNGKPLVATLGLSQEEAERQAIAGPPNGRRARAIGMTYRYGAEELAENGGLIRSGLAVPMGNTNEEEEGYLAVFSRSELDFGDESVDELEQLIQRASPAIENAQAFREARQLADLDALTGLHNRRYFHETLARECARAHRYNRSLALIVFDLDDFKAINDRIGHLAGDSVLADAAARVRDVVRSADIACRVGGDEFAVILPESTTDDADQLYRRIQHSMAAHPIGAAGRLLFSAGVAELRPDDDAVSFFQRADEALYRAKESGKGQILSAGNQPSA